MNPQLFGKPAGEWTDSDLDYAMAAYDTCEARLAKTSVADVRNQSFHMKMAASSEARLREIIETARAFLNSQHQQLSAQRRDAERQAADAFARAERDRALAAKMREQADTEEQLYNEMKQLADSAAEERRQAERRLSEIRERRAAEEDRLANAKAAADDANERAAQIGPLSSPRTEVIAAPFEAAADPAPATSDNCDASMDKYHQLRTGITYNRAQKIMGCSGTEMNQNRIGGVRTTTYEWSSGLFGGTIYTVFQNNRLTAKSQHGL